MRYLYDGDALVAEYDSAGTVLRRYVHGPRIDEPLVWYEGAAVAAATRRPLHANHQGSIVAVTSDGGSALGINAYDAWGMRQPANLGRFQYTGQILIYELGLYHYKARTYSPTLGRFLQTDPVGYDDQFNLYAYVRNDPVNALDPTGRDILLAIHPVRVLGQDSGYWHAKLVIKPDDQGAFANDTRFVRDVDDGQLYATVGAGPANGSLFRPLGNLVSDLNRDTDVSEGGIVVATLVPGRGETEEALIRRIFAADANYPDNLDYDSFPEESDGFNSNSYLSGLLRALGVEEPPTSDQQARPTPGYAKPVPTGCFEAPNEGCE